MVIIITPQGQLANRLFHASHFIANAIENNYSIYHLAFNEYFPWFSDQLNQSETKKFIKFINIKSRLYNKAVNLFVRLMRFIYKLNKGNFILFYYEYLPITSLNLEIPYDISHKKFQKKAKKIVFVDGWSFRDELSFIKNRVSIKSIFKPNKVFCDQSDLLMQEYRQTNEIIIGVHVRKGDYKFFNNGKYFYEDNLYKEKMKQVNSENEFFKKSVLFLICSNEDFDIQNLENLNINFAKRHFIIDLMLLSACNYIIGPPSTFSMWASFYGSVPVCFLTQENQDLSSESFYIIGKPDTA